MTTHSSILAWRIPQTEEPDRLQSVGSRRVRYDSATKHKAQTASRAGRRPQKESVKCSKRNFKKSSLGLGKGAPGWVTPEGFLEEVRLEHVPSPSSCSKLQSQSPTLLEFLAGCVTKFWLPAEKQQPPGAEAAQRSTCQPQALATSPRGLSELPEATAALKQGMRKSFAN